MQYENSVPINMARNRTTP